MDMKNPPHPGELIGETLHELDISITAAAKVLDVSRQHLYNIVKGQAAITPTMALKLEAALGSTAETWMGMQINYELAELAQMRKRIPSIKRLVHA
jgi:addiction module HigA family antidote